MRSYQIMEWGGPLVAQERPTPVPSGSEVLLRVTAAGICHTDLHLQDGHFDLGDGRRLSFAQLGARLPLTLGHEIAGVVAAVGPDVQEVRPGDARVVFPWIGCRTCAICAHEREQWCMSPKFLGARVDGGYSDHVMVPHPAYLLAHEGIADDLACTYSCAGLTAYSALAKLADLSADDTLLVIGAGGVGLTAIHMAKAVVPARLIVVERDPQRRNLAKAGGAAVALDPESPDARDVILDLTAGGAHASIDFVGGAEVSRFALESLRKGGRHVIVGLYGGALTLPLPWMVGRSLTVQGSYVGTLDEMKAVLALGQAGMIPPIPLDLRPLDQAPAALDDLRAGRVSGRVVLRPDLLA